MARLCGMAHSIAWMGQVFQARPPTKSPGQHVQARKGLTAGHTHLAAGSFRDPAGGAARYPWRHKNPPN